MSEFEPTGRTRIRRAPNRAVYDRQAIYAILDAGLICHVGYVRDGEPFVVPTAYWRRGDLIHWHGSSASTMVRAASRGIPVCLTVSMLDGLVLARSGFHTSFNYRSVIIYGRALPVEGERAKSEALEAFMNRIAPGRWPDLRPPTAQELKATTVLGMKIEEAGAKVRDGPPIDDPGDLDWPVWAGVIPIETVAGEPRADAHVKNTAAHPHPCPDFRIG